MFPKLGFITGLEGRFDTLKTTTQDYIPLCAALICLRIRETCGSLTTSKLACSLAVSTTH
jgi:hypothetical protein